MSEDDWDTSNKGKPWANDELRVILSDAPTYDNAVKHAKAFRRGAGSLEQIYRWAMAPKERIEEERADNKFILQIRKAAKELGWLS